MYPITLTPGNLPTMTSSKVVAAGEIEKFDDDFDIVSFAGLHDNKIKVDLTQNSAISIYLCIEDKYSQLDNLI